MTEVLHDDSTQCGMRGTRHFYFECRITCPEEALDERGFIVDQLEVLARVQKRYSRVRSMPSCERLALDACRYVKHILAPYASRIVFKLSTAPLNGDEPAGMEAVLEDSTFGS
jgi:hypothetical protein